MQNEKPSEKPPQEGSVVQERLNWQVAWRDDTKVGQALYAGETIEEIHHLSDAGLLDEFFVFLKELGMLEAFEQVSQSGVQRTLVSFRRFGRAKEDEIYYHQGGSKQWKRKSNAS